MSLRRGERRLLPPPPPVVLVPVPVRMLLRPQQRREEEEGEDGASLKIATLQPPPPCLPLRLPPLRPPRLLTVAPRGLSTARFGRRKKGAGRENASVGRISQPREERVRAPGQQQWRFPRGAARVPRRWEAGLEVGGGEGATPLLLLLLLLPPVFLPPPPLLLLVVLRYGLLMGVPSPFCPHARGLEAVS